MAASTLRKLLIAQWHPTKNYPLSLSEAAYSSRVWWQCNLGHEWEATISKRNMGQDCPYCSGNKVLAGFNDLQTICPTIAAEWHPVLNEELLPTEVSRGSKKRVWWLCSKSHAWDMPIYARTVSGQGCAYCSGKRTLVGYNDLATLYPAVAAQWHPTRNLDLTPATVVGKSGKKAWWLCDKKHEWEAIIANRTVLGSDCPFCSGDKILIGFNDLASTHPDLVKQWHPTKNNNLRPQDVSKGTNKKIWWICEEFHEWVARLTDRTRPNPHGCPTCSGNRTLSGYNDLLSQTPEIAKEWHPTKNAHNNTSSVNNKSNQKVWWLAGCDHEWEATVVERTGRGSGCPYCYGKSVLAGFNDLLTHRPDIAAGWHPSKNGSLSPSDVRTYSGKKVWWVCSKEHEWTATICHRTISNSGCPVCAAGKNVSKDEQDIADFLIERGLVVKQSDRLLLNGAELDIYMPEKKIAIEFNGVYWHSEKAGKSKNYHYDKWLAAKNAGIHLIQIWQDEWNRNPEQVKTILLHKLGISKEKKIFARNTTINPLTESDVESFLNSHHIERFAAGDYYLGLRDKVADELVAVMLLKKQAGNTFEIIRYATNKHVVGGFSKLLAYAEGTFIPDRLVAFSDHCVSDGSLYATNGFIADKEIAPDYRYVVKDQRKDKSEYTEQRFKEDPNLQWQDGLTEKELAKLNNIYRIWDAGTTMWVKTVG